MMESQSDGLLIYFFSKKGDEILWASFKTSSFIWLLQGRNFEEIKVVALEAAVDAENAEASTGSKTNQVKKKTMKRKKDRTRGSMTENQRKRK